MSSGRSAGTSGHEQPVQLDASAADPSVEAEAPEYLREAVDVVTARPADQVAATLPADIAQLLRHRTRGGAA
jgi:hypothetical protein